MDIPGICISATTICKPTASMVTTHRHHSLVAVVVWKFTIADSMPWSLLNPAPTQCRDAFLADTSLHARMQHPRDMIPRRQDPEVSRREHAFARPRWVFTCRHVEPEVQARARRFLSVTQCRAVNVLRSRCGRCRRRRREGRFPSPSQTPARVRERWVRHEVPVPGRSLAKTTCIKSKVVVGFMKNQ